MKPLLLSLLLITPALGQTLYADLGEIHIKLVYDHPWLATMTVDNGSGDLLVFPASSNPAPYLAGYSISGGDLNVTSHATSTATLYPWGRPEDMVIQFNGYSLPLAYTQSVPEPSLLGALILLPLIRRRR